MPTIPGLRIGQLHRLAVAQFQEGVLVEAEDGVEAREELRHRVRYMVRELELRVDLEHPVDVVEHRDDRALQLVEARLRIRRAPNENGLAPRIRTDDRPQSHPWSLRRVAMP